MEFCYPSSAAQGIEYFQDGDGEILHGCKLHLLFRGVKFSFSRPSARKGATTQGNCIGGRRVVKP
jgi:hypothetical protein